MLVTTGQTQLADGTAVVVRTPDPPSDHRKQPVEPRSCRQAEPRNQPGGRRVAAGKWHMQNRQARD